MQFFPNGAAIAIATLVQSELALSKIRLFKTGFTPSPSTTLAELEAEEVAFTGYPAGGETVTAFLDPVLNPLGGASIDWPTVQFASASPYTTSDVAGGWWLEDATGTTVYAIGTFAAPIPIGGAGTGFPLSGSLVFPQG